MLNRVNEISKEKIITTSTNIKKLELVKEAIKKDYREKTPFVDEMTNEEYTNYIYLRYLAISADNRKNDIKSGKIRKMHY